jgi:hypothetical protein
LYFNGTSAIETITNTNVIDLDASSGLSAGFTFEAWVRTNGAGEGTGGQMFFKGTNTWLKVTNLSSGLLDVSASVDLATTDATVTASAKVTDNRWAHIALTYTDDADDEITVWVNGISVASSTNGVGSLAADTNNLVIGGTTTNNFAGFIDEFKIYNYEKSATQMLRTFNALGSSDAVSTSLGGSGQISLSDGLVGYWKLDEASGQTKNCTATPFTDSSGNGNNGKSCPSTTGPDGGSTGKFGYSVAFDGSDDYIEVPNATPLHPGDTFTLSAWVKRSGTGTFDAVFGTVTNDFQLAFVNDNIKVSKQSIGDVFVSTSTYTDTTSWHSIIAVKNGSTFTKVYYDGVEIAGTYTDRTITIGSSPIYIGGDSNAADVFAGSIDEARIYNRALSAQEVKQLYNWVPGPVGYWNFDEKTGTTVTDKSGGGISATITDAGTAVGNWTAGKYGSAYNLKGGDGSDVDKINFGGSSVSLGTVNTVSFWVNFNNIGINGASVATSDQITCGTSCGYMAYFDNAGTFYSRQETGSAVSVSTGTLTMGRWYHFAVVRSGTSITFYMNGAKVGATQTLGANNAFSLYSLTNFRTAGANDFPVDGSLDEIKVYNYDRTPQQIIEDMNGGHPTGGSPVGSYVSYWKMDESNSTTAHDYNALSGNDLTLSTSSWDLSGKTNTAWKGVGTNWLSRADDDDFDFAASDNFSISMWFKSTSATNPAATEYLIAKGRSAPPGYALYMNTSGFLCLSIDDDVTWTPDDSACTTTDMYDGTWHHVVAEKTGTTEIRVYVDTKSVASDVSLAATGTLANSGTLYVGDDDGDSTNAFNGDIDEVKIYRAALTTDQINMDYNGGAAINFGSTASVESSQLTDGTGNAPIGWWKFDEKTGTSAVDSTGNANTGTLTNGPLWTSGKYGSALNFDGADDVVDVGSASSLDDLGPMTLEAWVYPRSLGEGGLARIFEKQATVNTLGWRLQLNTSNSLIFAQDYATTDLSQNTANNTLTLNAWNHVAVTWDGTTTVANVHVYINGAEVSYSSSTNGSGARQTDAAQTLKIGNTTDGTRTFDGTIDDAKVYNYIRTAAQVAYDYNRGGPVGWWKFDECSGTTTNDSSGNSLTGTWSGATGSQTTAGTCTTSSTAWGNGTSGKLNSSLNFDGTDDSVSVSDSNLLDVTTNFSISSWVYLNSFPTNCDTGLFMIANKGRDASTTYAYALNIAGNSGCAVAHYAFQFELYDGSNNPGAYSTTTPTTGTWYHVVGTYDGTNIKMYVNGKLEDSRATTVTPGTQTSSFVIGKNAMASNRYLDGKIDDVRIYNYALSLAQIQKIYNGGGSVNFGPATGQP